MSDEEADLSKAMRLMYAARAAATGPAGEAPIRYLYFDIRNQARAGLPAALHEEFDALFPSTDSEAPVGVERLSALGGYLEGIVQSATLGRRIASEAEAEERQVEARHIRREQAEDAEDAARAESEGYPLGRGGEEGDPSRR
ncbi:MAG: hypothetical protein ACAH79_02715 [Thermoleophilia bacterium]